MPANASKNKQKLKVSNLFISINLVFTYVCECWTIFCFFVLPARIESILPFGLNEELQILTKTIN